MIGSCTENANVHHLATGHSDPAARVPDITVEPDTLLTRAMLSKEQMSTLLPQLTRDELYELGNWLRDTADERIEQELLQVLRAMCSRCPSPAGDQATSIEFVTNPNYPEGVYWDEETFWLHGADGQDWQYEEPEQRDDSTTALDIQFRDLLADYSRIDRPEHNSNLTVNLPTGTFEVTPPSAY